MRLTVTLDGAPSGRDRRGPLVQNGVTATTTQLLEALLDPSDEGVWFELDGRYRPIVFAMALRIGLDAEEATEVAQTTLAEFARDYRGGRYARERGRLRGWLLGIARHRITDTLRERARRRGVRGDSVLDQLPGVLGDDSAAEQQLEAIWEERRRAVILERALETLRISTAFDPRTIQVFELAALRRVPTDAVATECGVTPAEVYRIKHRVAARLRAIVQGITETYDEGER